MLISSVVAVSEKLNREQYPLKEKVLLSLSDIYSVIVNVCELNKTQEMTAARTKITMIETSKIFLFREIMLTLMFFLAKGFGVDYTVFYYIAILQSSILPCILTIKENSVLL
jgi:hypothetical protein